MFSVVISIISFSNKTGLKCFYTCTPFQCIHLFLHAYCSELCSQQDAVISEVALYKRLLNWSNSKCYKKKFSFLRGRKKQKKILQDFRLFLASFDFFCLFVCKPRHQCNHNPPANSSKAEVTVKRTWNPASHHRVYNPQPCCSKFGSSGGCILWALMLTPEAKLGTALALSREEVQDTAITQSSSSPQYRPGAGK